MSVVPSLPPRPPWVSIVVPVYDGAGTLGLLIESLSREAAAGARFEVVAVDDGSSDGSRALLVESARRLPFPLLVEGQPNAGCPSARNRGIRASRGEIVAFLDQDCAVEPGWIEAITSGYEDPRLGGVGGRTLPARVTNLVEAYAAARRHLELPALSQGGVEYVIGGNSSFRRGALLEVGGFDERFRTGAEDWDLSIRIRKAGWRIAYRAEAVVRHHHRSDLRGLVRTFYRYGRGYARIQGKYGGRSLPGNYFVHSLLFPLRLPALWWEHARSGAGWARGAAFAFFDLLDRWASAWGRGVEALRGGGGAPR